jgi:hypothetical protein
MCDQQPTINNIDFKDPKFATKTQFTTNIGYHAYTTDEKDVKHYKYVKVMEKDSKTGKLKVKLDENGNQIYKRNSNNEKIPVLEEVFEETPFVFNRWPGTTSAEHTPSEKRVSLKLNHYPDQPLCEEVKNTFLKYDKLVEEKRKEILGMRDEMYSYIECVKIPDETDDVDENAKKYPKYPNSKLKLQMIYTYHNKHTGERFDEINERVIGKAIRETLEDKNKSLDNLSIVLYQKNEETGKLEKKSYLYKDDIEDRCVIGTIVKFCKAENVNESTKKPWECTEDEIESLYGKLEQVDVKTPEDLDKYYTANCCVRYLFSPTKLWASKNKDPAGKKKNFGIIFTCYQLHIIQLPNKKTESSTGLTTKKKFETHTFGQKQLLSLTRSESSQQPKEQTKVLKEDVSDSEEDEQKEEEQEEQEEQEQEQESGVSSSESEESEPEPEPVKKKSSKSAPAPAPAPTPTQPAPTKKIAKKIVVEESEESEELDNSSSSEEEVVVETKKKTTSTKGTTKVLKK